jgi:uncharacterized protein (TIGR03067 family)
MNRKLFAFLLPVLFVIIAASSLSAQTFFPKTLTGRWIHPSKVKEAPDLEFTGGDNITVHQAGASSLQGKFVLDKTKNPMWFDIIFQKPGETEKLVVKGLASFLDENTMKWQLFQEEEKRPNTFLNRPDDRGPILMKRKL